MLPRFRVNGDFSSRFWRSDPQTLEAIRIYKHRYWKFLEAGWHGRDAILMTGINAIIYLLSTIPPCVKFWVCMENMLIFVRWYLVDRWGRRAILLSGAIVVRPRNSITRMRWWSKLFRWQSRSWQLGGGCGWMSRKRLRQWWSALSFSTQPSGIGELVRNVGLQC